MLHKETLLAAARIIDERGNEYGDMIETHKRIARLFNDMVPDVKLEAHHVAAVHMATKLARVYANPTHEDSFIDLAAYTAFRSELTRENVERVEAFKPLRSRIPPAPRNEALAAIQDAIGKIEE
jgi:hypothetical protein